MAVRAAAWGLAGAWTLKTLSVSRNLPRVPDLRRPEWDRWPIGEPRVTAIVPARNEEASVAACVRSLLGQDYPGLRVIAVDDRSVDRTGELLDALTAENAGRLTVLHIRELPEGWLGKTHAMAMAARHALAEDAAAWLLFTDGDVLFHREAVRRSLVLATAEGADHLVTLPTPIRESAGETTLLGFLQVLGLWALRLWRVPDPTSRDAVGVGAFNLLRAPAYRAVGGYESLRLQIVEDLALGRRVKEMGLRQRVAVAPGYVRVHWAAGVGGIVRTMTKNLFAIFGYRLGVLGFACPGLLVLCVGPFAGLAFRRTRVPSAVAVGGIVALYRVSERLSGVSPVAAVGFPVAAVVFVFAVLRSAAVTLAQGGVEWRGTMYPLGVLRAQTPALPVPFWRSPERG